jgi:hypothetical protein
LGALLFGAGFRNCSHPGSVRAVAGITSKADRLRKTKRREAFIYSI